MIKIDKDGLQIKYAVDTDEKKAMCAISQSAFELACIAADFRIGMKCIDQKYGKGSALKLFGVVTADIYTLEEIEKADKEINGYE